MKDVPTLDYPFSSADLEAAYKEWGCNCGPSALAFALQLPLDRERGGYYNVARRASVSGKHCR